MRKMKYCCGMLFLSILLISQITACGGGGEDVAPGPTPGLPFLTSDLAGTWYFYAANGASAGIPPAGSIAAGNLRGTLILDSLGQVVPGGTYTRSNNQSAAITGGLIGMDSSGVLNGSFTTNLGVNFYLGSGNMDSTKNIVSFVASTNYGEYDLVTAVRAAGGFSSLDLAANWYVFGAGGDYGQITVNDLGNGVRATIVPGGGGFITIDGNGMLNSTLSGTSYVNAASGTDLYLTSGKINLAKDMMFFVASTSTLTYDLVTAIRAGGAFTSADFSGTWSISGAGTSGTNKATLNGTVILDATGKVTGGSYTRTDSTGKTSFALTSGTVKIDNAGVLGGSAGNLSFASGKMNAAKGMMSLVGSTAGGEKDFLFCVKVN